MDLSQSALALAVAEQRWIQQRKTVTPSPHLAVANLHLEFFFKKKNVSECVRLKQSNQNVDQWWKAS